jgi:hypothetical protein
LTDDNACRSDARLDLEEDLFLLDRLSRARFVFGGLMEKEEEEVSEDKSRCCDPLI